MDSRACVDCGKQIKNPKATRCRSCANRVRGGGQEARFLSYVDTSGGPDACHPFTRSRHQQGYGRMMWNGKLTLAHRIAYDLAHPDDPLRDDEDCLHECDNPPCCNARHLHKGDQSSNQQEAYDRQRRSAVGTDNAHAKLTEELVREIEAAVGSQQEIADRYGIHQTQVSRIKRHVHWPHLWQDES